MQPSKYAQISASPSERPLFVPLTRGERGFTLIEMMAVVAIMAMVFAIGAPQLRSSKFRILRDEAETIAASLEFARQRAVMTGAPHRLLIDLEEGAYRVEWYTTEEQAFAKIRNDEEVPALSERIDILDETGPLDLRPPARSEREYYPVSHRKLGTFNWIDDATYFVGLKSPGGWSESGDAWIVFQSDGTTENTLLEMADADDNHLTLEIEPMLDRVRTRRGGARS